MNTPLRAILSAFGLILAGCANPYAQFYHGNPNPRTIEGYLPPSGPLELYSSSNVASDVETMERRGYAPVGSSDFNGAANRVSESQVRKEAQTLGASAVLVSSHYTRTMSGAIPLTIPNTTTSMTNGNAMVTGSNGYANVNSTATTTTYGTQTVMMPYQVQRSDFTAVYFIKRHSHFGVIYGVIDPTTRARLQTNAGVLIKTVVEGAVAARADILPGDIILTIDGERVDGVEAFNSQVKQRYGHQVVLGIDRNGTRIEKLLTPAP